MWYLPTHVDVSALNPNAVHSRNAYPAHINSEENYFSGTFATPQPYATYRKSAIFGAV